MPDKIRDELIDVLESISKAQLKALRRLRQSSELKAVPGGPPGPKSMSQVNMAYDILLSAGRPLHVSEIIALVAKRYGVALDRESIVSAMVKRVARKDRFLRTAPNTFAVMPKNER